MADLNTNNAADLAYMQAIMGIPTNRDVMCIGDSRTAQNYSSAISHVARGYSFWAQTFSKCGARYTYAGNLGINGYTTGAVLTEFIPVAILRPEATAVYLAETNDRGGNFTWDGTVANVTAALTALLAAGKFVILVLELPRGGSFALAGDQLAYHVQFRRWARDLWGANPRVKFVDMWPAWTQYDASASPISGKLYDDLHPAAMGAFELGAAIAAAHDEIMGSPADILPVANGGLWNTNAGRGSLNPNPMLSGTAGSKSGTPTPTGTVASNSTLATSQGTGLSAVGSMVAKNGYALQQIDISGTPTDATPQVYLTQSVSSPSGKFSVGDIVEAVAYVEVSAGQTGLAAVRGFLALTDSVSAKTTQAGQKVADEVIPATAWNGVIRTPPITVQGSVSAVAIGVYAMLAKDIASSISIRIGRMEVRKVT